MLNDDIRQCLSRWLGDYHITPHRCGANSQGYIVRAEKQKYFLKVYPTAQNSQLRIQRELDFVEYCACSPSNQYATVVASAIEQGCVLFDFIDSGDDQVMPQEYFVEQAMHFIKCINQNPCERLVAAADAAHTLLDFTTLIENRLSQLENVHFPVLFLDDITSLIRAITNYYQQLKSKNQAYLELIPYVLASPSDFGLHNALITNERVYFIDFEYAGKDSLWKLFADFFAQPEKPMNSMAINRLREFISLEQIENNKSSFCYIYQLTLIKWSLLMLQTGLRLYNKPEHNDKLQQHLIQVQHYFSDIDNKLELMHKNISMIRS